MEKINEIVRQKRKELKLSQGVLAEKVGIKKQAISLFESGKTSLGSKTLDKILIELDIDIK